MRLFVGITLPPALVNRLQALGAGLKGARWVAAENLHVTMRFIGEVDPPAGEDLHHALSHIRARPFTLRPTELGTFGHPPRTLWLGVRSAPAEALAGLHARIERACQVAGCEAEARAFSPHITLARFRNLPAALLARYLEANGGTDFAPFPVQNFTLLESHLTAAGAHYRALAAYPLAGES